ncbi:MAG: hypothetical protein R3324_05815 [Halobacteriales archaeon]|nr:hypothetical protein [Halobacteriales archaeon]
MRTTLIVICALALAACGGENNSDNNGGTNGATNAATNAATNSTATNGGTTNGGTTNGSTGGSVATVNWDVTVGEHSTTITECNFEDGTTTGISMTEQANGVYTAFIGCKAVGVESATDAFVVDILVFSDVSGTVDASDFEFTLEGDTFTGNVRMNINYQDGAAGILLQGRSMLITDRTGSLTVDTFNTDTGEFSGSMDVTLTGGDGTEYSVSGTFSATLYDCTGQNPCNGSGM